MLTEDLLKSDFPSKIWLPNSVAPKTACSSKSTKTARAQRKISLAKLLPDILLSDNLIIQLHSIL